MLCEVTSQYARRNGPPLDVLIYGGAAVTLRHKFRTAANDIDYALLEPSPLFEDCVEDVGKRYRLLPFWMHGLERFASAPRFRENFYRHADVLRLNAESGNLSFLVQDSDWQLANKLCWFRRYRKMTAGTLQASCRNGMVMQQNRFPKACGMYLAGMQHLLPMERCCRMPWSRVSTPANWPPGLTGAPCIMKRSIAGCFPYCAGKMIWPPGKFVGRKVCSGGRKGTSKPRWHGTGSIFLPSS